MGERCVPDRRASGRTGQYIDLLRSDSDKPVSAVNKRQERESIAGRGRSRWPGEDLERGAGIQLGEDHTSASGSPGEATGRERERGSESAGDRRRGTEERWIEVLAGESEGDEVDQ